MLCFSMHLLNNVCTEANNEKLQMVCPICIVDDLTRVDWQEKRRVQPLMNKLYKENKRPFFRNGRLYAENRPVRRVVPPRSDSIHLHIVRAIRADIDINHNSIIIFYPRLKKMLLFSV